VRFVTPIFHSAPPVCPIPPLGSDRFKKPPAAPKNLVNDRLIGRSASWPNGHNFSNELKNSPG
jgi:hypothetical protein